MSPFMLADDLQDLNNLDGGAVAIVIVAILAFCFIMWLIYTKLF